MLWLRLLLLGLLLWLLQLQLLLGGLLLQLQQGLGLLLRVLGLGLGLGLLRLGLGLDLDLLGLLLGLLRLLLGGGLSDRGLLSLRLGHGPWWGLRKAYSAGGGLRRGDHLVDIPIGSLCRIGGSSSCLGLCLRRLVDAPLRG